MGVYIKNWSLADWKELLKWAKIGANNSMIGELTEVGEVPPHGRLIDADALPLEESVPTVMMHDGERWISAYELAMAPTIIPADKDGDA